MNYFKDFLPSDENVCTSANVLVIDFGDGEVVINTVQKDGRLIRLEIQPEHNKCVQALTGGTGAESLSLWSDNDELIPEDNYTYWHYKVHPDEAEYAPFVWHNGKKEPSISLTNGDLMAKAFYELLTGALRNPNNASALGESWDSEKPTYVFVGRPSDERWAESDLQYVKLLKEYEKYLDEDGTVAVFGSNATNVDGIHLKKESLRFLILSESDAAYAEMVCKPRKGTPLSDQEYAVVVDMGSSTVDVIVIYRRNLVLKDALTLGGGDLDDCITRCLGIRESGVQDPFAPLKIRDAKESFFGTMKKNATTRRDVKINFRDGHQADLSEEIMEKALCSTPVVKYGAEYASWKDGICLFLEKVKAQIAEKVPEDAICHLYLTGGVSNMTECRSWAEAVFGIAAEIPDGVPSPSYVVGDGLSYIARVELKKEQARSTTRSLVERELNKKADSFKAKMERFAGYWLADGYLAAARYYRDHFPEIKKALAEDVGPYKEYFSFHEFVWEQTPKALNPDRYSWKQYIVLDEESRSVLPYLDKGIGLWWEEEKISEMLTDAVRKGFEELFPSAQAFDFRPDFRRTKSYFSDITYYYNPQKLNRLRGLFGVVTRHRDFPPEEAVEFFQDFENHLRIGELLFSYKQNGVFSRSVSDAFQLFKQQIEEQLDLYIDMITPYRLI